MERFTGLSIHSLYNAMKFLWEYFHGNTFWYLDQTCLLFSIIKERYVHYDAYELVVFVAFTNIQPFGKELDCSRELITMTVMR